VCPKKTLLRCHSLVGILYSGFNEYRLNAVPNTMGTVDETGFGKNKQA